MESKLSNVERWRRIVEHVNHGSVSVSELVREFAVSEMTIRCDLAALEQQGRILRVHGGAIASGRLAYEFAFRIKETRNVEAKKFDARKQLETAVQLNPNLSAAHYNLGSVYHHLSLEDKSHSAYEQFQKAKTREQQEAAESC